MSEENKNLTPEEETSATEEIVEAEETVQAEEAPVEEYTEEISDETVLMEQDLLDGDAEEIEEPVEEELLMKCSFETLDMILLG